MEQKDILFELKRVVEANKTSGGTINWVKVGLILNGQYPNERRTVNSWRMMYRRNFNKKYQVTKKRVDAAYNDKKLGRVDVDERIINQIKKRKELHYLADLFGYTDEELLLVIQKLKLAGYGNIQVWDEDGKIFVHNPNYKFATSREYEIKPSDEIKIAVVTDTHLGSTFAAEHELHQFYEYINSLGITKVLHLGDLTDGWYQKRPTSIFEQTAVGFQNQLNYFVNHYPRVKGIKTYAITGNHDQTHMFNGGANMGELVARLRDDFVYLGHNHAFFKISDKVKISLIHPTDGSTQTISYKIQQVIDRNAERKAEIMLIGHYHKTASVFYKGSWGFMCPSFQHKSSFMSDNNLTSDVGGMILTIKLNKDGSLKSLNSEWVMYK
jgi:UDP-2,3-diacylglucosamine pyrophosphatase LpxH